MGWGGRRVGSGLRSAVGDEDIVDSLDAHGLRGSPCLQVSSTCDGSDDPSHDHNLPSRIRQTALAMRIKRANCYDPRRRPHTTTAIHHTMTATTRIPRSLARVYSLLLSRGWRSVILHSPAVSRLRVSLEPRIFYTAIIPLPPCKHSLVTLWFRPKGHRHSFTVPFSFYHTSLSPYSLSPLLEHVATPPILALPGAVGAAGHLLTAEHRNVNEAVVVFHCVSCLSPAAGVEHSRAPRISILYISSVRLDRPVNSSFLFHL